MLTPEVDFSQAELTLENDYNQGYQTFKLNFETGEISRQLISGIETVKQFAYLALNTPRFEHPIYSGQFGSELLALIKDKENVTEAYFRSEFERLVKEALIYDDRIDDITDFEMTIKDDKAYITFNILSMGHVIEYSEVFDIEI